MDTFECIVTRRSIRKYLDIPVEWEKVGVLLEAVKWAPSPGNLQNTRVVVVKDADKRKQIADACLGQFWMAKAPVHLIICSETENVAQHYGMRGERLYAIQGVAAAIQNILLTAKSQGLGSCWIGAFIEEKITAVCNIPDKSRPQAVITIGYPDESPNPPMKQSVEIYTFLENYWSRIKDMQQVMGYTSGKVQMAVDFARTQSYQFLENAKKISKVESDSLLKKAKTWFDSRYK